MKDFMTTLQRSRIPKDKISPEQTRVLHEIFDACAGDDLAIERMQAYYESGKISSTVILKMSKAYDELGPQIDGIYQHVEKPIQVKIISNGIDEATMEHVVIYHHVDEAVVWTRSAESFKMRFKFIKFEPQKVLDVNKIKEICKAMLHPEDYFRHKAEIDGNHLDGMMIIRLVENHHWYQNEADKILKILEMT